MKSFFKDKRLILAALLFIGFTAWWLYLRLVINSHDSKNPDNTRFTVTYGLIALYGGVFGLVVARKWGGFKSVLGRAISVFSIGLLFQELGQLAYTYYLYNRHIEVPYPSLGDIGYFGSVIFYIYAAFLLSKVIGARLSLHSFGGKIKALIIPIAVLAGSYAIFLRGYEFKGTPLLTVILDFGYPLGQAIYLSIALLAYLLSRKLLGGVMKNKVLLVLFALVVQYIADFTFLYQVQHGSWYAGGWNDYIYLVSYFVMTVALLNLGAAYNRVKG